MSALTLYNEKMRLCIGDQIEINRRFNKEICEWLGDDGIAHAIYRIQSLGETEKILHLRLWFGDEEVYWTGKREHKVYCIRHLSFMFYTFFFRSIVFQGNWFVFSSSYRVVRVKTENTRIWMFIPGWYYQLECAGTFQITKYFVCRA